MRPLELPYNCLILKLAVYKYQLMEDGKSEERHFICLIWLAGGTPFGSHWLQAQGCETKREQKFVACQLSEASAG